MITKYAVESSEFCAPEAVRAFLLRTKNTAFGPEPEGLEARKTFWAALGVSYSEEPDEPIEVVPPYEPTEEEKAYKALQEKKRARSLRVAAIVVEVDGMSFDGDETAQSRMLNTITAMEASGDSTTEWVLSDDTVATVTLEQLRKAHATAVADMNRLWAVPYKNEASASSVLDDY